MLNKLTNRKFQNKIIYTMCFFMFMVIDQRTKTLPSREGWLFVWQNMLGIVVALLIMTHYKWEDIKKYKWAYMLWGALGTLGTVVYFNWRSEQNVFFANATTVLLIDIILYGYIVIYTCINLFVKKEVLRIKKSFLCVWIVMMLLMIFSRSEYLWPLGYLVMFGCLCLTNFSKEEVHDMLMCGCNGIILAFLVIQGLAFVLRPYEYAYIRYNGMYTNSNQNAFFYVCVVAALLIKAAYYKKQESKLGYYCCYFLTVIAFDFMLLALGRTAILVAVALVLIFFKIIYGKLFKKETIMQMLLGIVGIVVALPLCFCAARYIPPIFHHPIWFDGEWNASRVHSWDPWDSKGYATFEQYGEEAFGRLWESITSVLESSPLKLDVRASEAKIVSKNEPLLTLEEANNSILFRKTIYEEYAKKLNWCGHPYQEQGVQVTEKFFTYHAHNFYLQYGTDFGIPVMILLIVLIVWGCFIYGKRIYKESKVEDIAMLMFILVPALYGILEYSWGIGSMGTTMLFLAWRISD